MSNTIFFNAQHSPIGAFASFTLGERGAKGGFGHEIGKPADQNVYIGLESATEEGTFDMLPFYGAPDGVLANYTPEEISKHSKVTRNFPDEAIEREYHACIDTWRAGDLSFRITSPVKKIPDPETASESSLKDTLLPVVFVDMTVDNSESDKPRRVVFGYGSTDSQKDFALHYMKHNHKNMDQLNGIGCGRNFAIVSCNGPNDPVHARVGFEIETLVTLPEDPTTSLGGCAAMVATIPPNEEKHIRFAICFHREGMATSGMDARYLYNRWWKDVREVAHYAVEHHDRLVMEWQMPDNNLLIVPQLSEDQKFQLVHAVHSYYGSTQLLELDNGKPFWIVNEGEYRMINTLDLVVDHAFFELTMNPWTVKNNLDAYADTHSYYDEVSSPADPTKLLPGGVTFTHDMGVANHISPPQYSAYERPFLTDCFSYMSCEELTNWILTACMYIHISKDADFVSRRLGLIKECLQSLVNRDHPDPAQRTGVMKLNSSRTKGGAEITTYDSLDTSLGQATENIYIAGKCWASYLALEKVLRDANATAEADLAATQADLCARTMVSAVDKESSLIPAIINTSTPHAARIIPAIEALVYPLFTGRKDALAKDGKFAEYLQVLTDHYQAILKPGICLFEDGGWKLSSTSDNSWLSKIYLCQFVARNILHQDIDPKADAAHVAWLTAPKNTYWAWSDQIIAGVALGSKYYPRGVTSILWCTEDGNL
ncbi:hypothetical protein K450DRAFT_283475 [Umbelopsis ramanniana AG]|uniref:Beta-xylosidase n=1 Tax=Umbelopsis ramanniana AG TaxID=1314678 RepID=A0AAD5E4V2_UMBRA|nr:uncharacterized protein K450DRAFT_283475 [Umbelopsis ramanniana AG]KAI8576380.1 hypothetical protein K450DRAFT_283475 [Umbelopsis ramanniana AG]